MRPRPLAARCDFCCCCCAAQKAAPAVPPSAAPVTAQTASPFRSRSTTGCLQLRRPGVGCAFCSEAGWLELKWETLILPPCCCALSEQVCWGWWVQGLMLSPAADCACLAQGARGPMPHSSSCHRMARCLGALPWTGSSCCMPDSRLHAQAPGSCADAVRFRQAQRGPADCVVASDRQLQCAVAEGHLSLGSWHTMSMSLNAAQKELTNPVSRCSIQQLQHWTALGADARGQR